MKLASTTFFISSFLFPFSALAQVTPDGTTSTTVTSTDKKIQIDNGNRAGSNLFHSFDEFSIPTDSEAYFNNANDITNIFSRVTGSNISNIDGLIHANGTANLFLINPNGILFGENARLQLGGSFYGSTADSIIFPDGEFSATDLNNPPLITINAPIGLGFRDNPGNITNRANFGLTESTITPGTETEYTAITSITGLEVDEGKRLALIGGNIALERSGLTAPGGYIELGGLSEAGTIGINNDGSLTFPEGVARSDVNLTDNAKVDIRGSGGGSLKVNARNLTLADKSRLFTGILEGMGSPDAVAGDIIVDATESVKIFASGDFDKGTELQKVPLRIDTAIISWVGLPGELRSNPDEISTAQGQGGSITVNTPLLEMTTRDAGILNFSYGTGNTGSISIQADSINLDNTSIGAFVRGGRGDAGNVNIEANKIVLKNGGSIISQIIDKGEGNAGNIDVTTTEFFNATGSYIGTDNSGQGKGDGGNIYIESGNLLTLDSVAVQSVVKETVQGKSGNITLKAFNIDINANSQLNRQESKLLADTRGIGKSGDIKITTDFLSLDNTEVLANNEPPSNTPQAQEGGNITLSVAENFFMQNNSKISAQAGKNANGGNVNINADFIVAYLNENNDIVTKAEKGKGGKINISAEAVLGLEERKSQPENSTNDIDASSEFGLDGTVIINTPDNNPLRENIKQSQNVVASTVATTNSCDVSATEETTSGLIVKGKGGVTPKPTEPIDAEILIVDEENLSNLSRQNSQSNPEEIPSYIQPVAYQDNGEPIYLARGVIVQEDGSVILTAYETDNTKPRTPDNSYSCQ